MQNLLAPLIFPIAPIAICYAVEHLTPILMNSLPPCVQ